MCGAKRRVGATGTAAKTRVTRNKAAYIAGGAGLAAGAVGGAVLARRKRRKTKIDGQATFGATFFHAIKISLVFKRENWFCAVAQ